MKGEVTVNNGIKYISKAHFPSMVFVIACTMHNLVLEQEHTKIIFGEKSKGMNSNFRGRSSEMLFLTLSSHFVQISHFHPICH